MKTFGWTEKFCRTGIVGARSWVWYYWAVENEATMFGRLYERNGDGYIGQEAKRLFSMMKKSLK